MIVTTSTYLERTQVFTIPQLVFLITFPYPITKIGVKTPCFSLGMFRKIGGIAGFILQPAIPLTFCYSVAEARFSYDTAPLEMTKAFAFFLTFGLKLWYNYY